MANPKKALGGAASGAASGAALGSVIPGLGTAIGAGLGGLIGGIGGLFGGDDHDDEIQKLQLESLDAIRNLKGPEYNDLKLALQRYESTGELSPELEEAVVQKASELKTIKSDPALRQAQMGALAKLGQVGEEGFTAETRAANDAAQREVARDATSRNQAILQNMQARGAGGSGAELAMQMAASQASADRGSQASSRLGAEANRAALEAILQRGNLAGNVRGQDFTEQERIASAQDAINRFNTANQQSVAHSNTGTMNDASRYNLDKSQRISDQNTNMGNQEQQANKQLLVDKYNRDVQKAQLSTNAANKQASNLQAQDAASNQGFTDMMAGIGTAASGVKGLVGGKVASPTYADSDNSVGASAPDSYKENKFKKLFG